MPKNAVREPDGFAYHESGRVRLFYDNRLLPAESAEFFEKLPELLGNLPAKKSRSRRMKSIWELEAQDWFPHGMMARQYVHGGVFGLAAGPLRTFFIDPSPMTAELQTASHLLRRGVRTSRPLVLRLEYGIGPFFSAILVSEKIVGVLNILQLCSRVVEGSLDFGPAARHRLLKNTAGSIAQMHANRVYHGDLNLKNVMIRVDGGRISDEVYLIDFKKAVLCDAPVPAEKGVSNLNRLWRSMRKWPDSAAVFPPEDRTALLESYGNAR